MPTSALPISSFKPLPCKACRHPRVDELNQLLIGSVDGTSQRSIRSLEAEFDISRGALARHKTRCIRHAMQTGIKKRRDSTLTSLQKIFDTTQALLDKAKKAGNIETALRAIQRLESQLKLQGDLLGDFQEKKPNMEAEQRKQQQVGRAVDQIIQKAAQEGITLTRQEAIDKLLEIEPAASKYIQ